MWAFLFVYSLSVIVVFHMYAKGYTLSGIIIFLDRNLITTNSMSHRLDRSKAVAFKHFWKDNVTLI